MACDLWVRGQAWTGYEEIRIDKLYRAGYELRTFPLLTRVGTASGGSVIFSDGLGGEFNGTGWYGSPEYYFKNCTEVSIRCDCLNGGCIPQSTYNTPGKYSTLAECQSKCAKDSPCDGECVSKAEIAALQQAANNLQSRLCQ